MFLNQNWKFQIEQPQISIKLELKSYSSLNKIKNSISVFYFSKLMNYIQFSFIFNIHKYIIILRRFPFKKIQFSDRKIYE